MAQSRNVGVVRDWYGTRDHGRLMVPGVVHEIAEGFPHGGTYRGREAAFGEGGFFPRLLEDFPEWRADVDDVRDAGPFVVSTGRYHARAAGGEVDAPFVHLWWVEGGKITRFRNYTDTLLIRRASEGGSEETDPERGDA